MTAVVAAGCLLAVAPLLLSMLSAELALQQLTRETQALLDEGLTAAQIGMKLRSDATNLERVTRQYLALKNSDLLPVVDNRWTEVNGLITRLAALRETKDLHVETNRLHRDYVQAKALWSAAGTDPDVALAKRRTAIGKIQQLESVIDSVLDNSRQQVEIQISHLRAATRRARTQIVLSAAALVPLALLLAWGFSRAVARPLERLTEFITRLRRGDYDVPVAIGFPSELRRLAQQLNWLRRRLARLEVDKDRFLRQVSHELKTPLASLGAGTDLLGGGAFGELNQRQMEIISILSESSRELEGLIDNLLAYAEWRAERQTAQWEWFDVRTFVQEVVAAHTLPMAERRLTMDVDIRTERLFAMRDQMRVAVQNVFSNAIKHAPPESAIELDVGVREAQFSVSVRDWGSGVADNDKENIFKPFFRGSEAEEQQVRGTGVGLAIVQETVHAHGGLVSVEDAFPGARFRMVWPCPTV